MIEVNSNNCKIKIVDKALYKSFCKDNHSQNWADADVVIGLYYNDELLQLISLDKPRTDKEYQWELIRDCIKTGYTVNGGISKLWNYFIINNNVSSCICYSYPKNKKLYTDRYIKYLGFKNKKKAEDKGNEVSPQIDIYFPFGIVYKITDTETGAFYIGQTLSKTKWDNGYIGSGTLWGRYIKKNKNNEYKREILYFAEDPLDMYKHERDEIRKYTKVNKNGVTVIDHSTGCMNIDVSMHGMNVSVCTECGKVNGQHKKECSKFVVCKECGGAAGHHISFCSKAKICPECGSNGNHKKICSRAKKCEECGGINGMHIKTCSKAVICNECGCANFNHKKACSKFKPRIRIKQCRECGGKNGQHRKGCSKLVVCAECGETGGAHTISCSKYNHKYCLECKSTGKHKKSCSKYKQQEKCKKCGRICGHKFWCPEYRFDGVCHICGGESRHKPDCKKISPPCPECGRRGDAHRRICSQFKPKTCPECGGKYIKHKINCPKFNKKKGCPECGSSGNHKKTCSHYSEKKCSICGGDHSHKKSCPNYKRWKLCEECGTIGGNHKKSCSRFKPKKPCSECGSKSKHKPSCPKRNNKTGA